MSNKEILDNLNNDSRKYINDLYSFMTFFSSNNKYKYEKEELIVISSLLAALKNDSIISEYFNKNGEITYERIKDEFKRRNDIDLDKDVDFIDVSASPLLAEISLSKLFTEILIKIKYGNYLEKIDIPISYIDPYQIFDSLTNDNRDILYNLIIELTNIKSTNFMLNLSNYLYDYYYEFAKSFGINLSEEAEYELQSSKTYTFDNCKITIESDGAYITFYENANLNNMIYHINREFGKINPDENNTSSKRKADFINELELPATFEILSINHKTKIDRDLIENYLLKNSGSKNVPFELQSIEDDTVNIIWLDRTKTFNISLDAIKESQKIETTSTPTPYLEKYGFDLTKDEYIKDPSIGRDEEIKRIEQILLYPERDKSIIITGVAGSGKTALVKGLAYRIQRGKVPTALKKLRIISVDAATLVAGTKYVGTLEEKMKNILDEAANSKDIIIFMDEIHQALGAGKSENDSNSVSEILKPYLDYGRVRVIGATTTEEYNEFVTQNEAFKTRFKRVNLSEPSFDIIYQVLDDLIESYNHLSESKKIICPMLNLSVEEKDMIIKWLIDSTKETYRTYNDRCSNPRLVLDIIKEAYAIAAINDRDEVTIDDIANALSLEDRLYKSSKERQIQKLKELKPSYKETQIIDFRLIKK